MKKCYIASALLIIVCLAEMIAIMQPRETEVVLPKPEPQKVVVATTIVPAQKTEVKVEEVDLGDVVHQEAREPEFGFDFEYVCRVVAAECRGEPYEGQLAVAQCIWNTSLAKGNNPDEVVREKMQYAKPVSSKLVTESVRKACLHVFLNVESITDEPIRYFYSTKNGFVSKWHEENLEYVMTIGNHKFFKEKE